MGDTHRATPSLAQPPPMPAWLLTRWAAEPLDLLRELRKLRPTVVHFSGHGSPNAAGARDPSIGEHRDVISEHSAVDGARQHGLFFQGPDGRPQLVSTAALEQAFDAAGASVRLVVLNACYSEVQAGALLPHVDCVVGMGGSIRDDAARNFAIGFYGGLGERASVAAAYKQGCAAISLANLPDGDRPQLKVREGIDASHLILAKAHRQAALFKLYDVTAWGLGARMESWMSRQIAKASSQNPDIIEVSETERADRRDALEGVELDTDRAAEDSTFAIGFRFGKILMDASEAIEKRVEQRILLRESRRQQNLEAIVLGAVRHVHDAEQISAEEIDDDWIVRFFANAQDVSNSKLQHLWSHILARKITSSQTISVRTLEILRNLSSQEAHAFELFLWSICQRHDEQMFVVAENTLPWKYRHILIDCGLMGLSVDYPVKKGDKFSFFQGPLNYILSPRSNTDTTFDMGIDLPVQILKLSEAGRSIASLHPPPKLASQDYAEGLLKTYSQFFSIEVRYPGDRVMTLDDFLRAAKEYKARKP